MNDNDFLDLGKEKEEVHSITNPNKVIMKVLHTRTEIKIYPDGKTFQQSRSWFEDKSYEVKSKPKKELVKAKEVQLQQKEEY